MAERVGFIGLGIMGKPMARNLMKAGYELTVHNRSRGAVDELAKEGATAADSPKEVAATSDVVVTMLPDSPDVERIVAGEGGVLEGIREGSLIVDMSTISPVVTEELAGKATVAKVNVNDNKAIASQFRVMSIPTVIFFVDGVEKERLIGVQPKQKYIDTLNNL